MRGRNENNNIIFEVFLLIILVAVRRFGGGHSCGVLLFWVQLERENDLLRLTETQRGQDFLGVFL